MPPVLSRQFLPSLSRYRPRLLQPIRSLSTLPGHPYYYIHPHPNTANTSLLSLLPTIPPSPSLSLGTFITPPLTPTFETFTPNPHFLPLLHTVLSLHAHDDPHVHNLASTFISTTISTLKSLNRPAEIGPRTGVGGWIHISDLRAPVDWARIPDPQDIFGSLEVDSKGKIRVGSYEPCLGYRIWTRSGGVMQLPDYSKEKLFGFLVEEEEREKKEGKMEREGGKEA